MTAVARSVPDPLPLSFCPCPSAGTTLPAIGSSVPAFALNGQGQRVYCGDGHVNKESQLGGLQGVAQALQIDKSTPVVAMLLAIDGAAAGVLIAATGELACGERLQVRNAGACPPPRLPWVTTPLCPGPHPVQSARPTSTRAAP